MKKFNLYLVSDSTAETVTSVARSSVAWFEDVKSQESVWGMVRTKKQMEKLINKINKKPGFVMYTMVDEELKYILKETCKKLNTPCVDVLSPVVNELSGYLKQGISPHLGKQHELDEGYYGRVEAINFAIAHDDGQQTGDIENADIIIVGVSRTSKSPTCVYLAYRGYRAANIPFVYNCPLPANLFTMTKPMIIGLTISPERLIDIRKNRLVSIHQPTANSDYIDEESVKQEIMEAKKLCIKHEWPIIDVTRRSVEETAATIIQYYEKRKANLNKLFDSEQ